MAQSFFNFLEINLSINPNFKYDFAQIFNIILQTNQFEKINLIKLDSSVVSKIITILENNNINNNLIFNSNSLYINQSNSINRMRACFIHPILINSFELGNNNLIHIINSMTHSKEYKVNILDTPELIKNLHFLRTSLGTNLYFNTTNTSIIYENTTYSRLNDIFFNENYKILNQNNKQEFQESQEFFKNNLEIKKHLYKNHLNVFETLMSNKNKIVNNYNIIKELKQNILKK